MSSASWALQQAVFAALSVSGEIMAVAGDPPRVFDSVPRGSAFPYIVVGEDNETNWDTATEKGSEHTLSVHVWSRANGRKEIKLVAGAVRECLDGAALALSGHTLVNLRFVSASYARESDAKTTSARLNFRAVTEPN